MSADEAAAAAAQADAARAANQQPRRGRPVGSTNRKKKAEPDKRDALIAKLGMLLDFADGVLQQAGADPIGEPIATGAARGMEKRLWCESTADVVEKYGGDIPYLDEAMFVVVSAAIFVPRCIQAYYFLTTGQKVEFTAQSPIREPKNPALKLVETAKGPT